MKGAKFKKDFKFRRKIRKKKDRNQIEKERGR